MMRVWAHFSAMFVIAALASSGLYTNAIFFDTEKGDPNVLSATNLDGELTGAGINSSLCLLSEEAESGLTVSNTGSLPYTYDLIAENATGTACGSLEVQAFRNGQLEYSGSVGGFALSGFMLSATGSDEWRVKVKFPFETAGSCTFDTEVRAYQDGFLSGQAYFDTERATHTVSVNTGPECGPSVDLHLSKAISGDDQGYEFSDFSYRVSGEGIDTVVPHDGTVALTEGIYSIEELVPEGFIKDDWRIGWYGQCEAGSTFSTSITIDEGNIDHGTLYCQADNQYRPENNEEEEMVESETTSGGGSSDRTRDTRTTRGTVRGAETTSLETNDASSTDDATETDDTASSTEDAGTEATTTQTTILVSKSTASSTGEETVVTEEQQTEEAESESGEVPADETGSSSEEESTEEMIQPEPDEPVEETEPEEPVAEEPESAIEESTNEATAPVAE